MDIREIEPRLSQEIINGDTPRQTATDHFNEVVSLSKLASARTEFWDRIADKVVAIAEAMRVFQSPIEEVEAAGQAYQRACQEDEKLGRELTTIFQLARLQLLNRAK